MNRPTSPRRNHRWILCVVGTGGLLFLWFSLSVAWFLQGGFGPGSNPPPTGPADLFITLLLSIPCTFYIVLANRAWTRRMRLAGFIIHGLTIVILIILSFTVL